MTWLTRTVLLAVTITGTLFGSTALSQPQQAAAGDFTALYYLNPQPDLIAGYLQQIDTHDTAAANRAFGTVTGFMSEIFRSNPTRIDAWLSQSAFSRNTQTALVYALWLADMHEAALSATQRFQWSASDIANLKTAMMRTKNLAAVSPGNGNDLDMFWGAFFASGRPDHVHSVLRAYNSRARNAGIDPQDILGVAKAMGTRDKTAAAEDLKKIRARYPDNNDTRALIVAAAALWALGSNADQHDRVRELITDHLRGAQDDGATAVLGQNLAQASKAVIGPTPEARVFILTTRDANFLQGPVRDMIDRKAVPKVDKVFAKQDQAFLVVLALTKPGEVVEYSTELVGIKGGIEKRNGRIQGRPSSHAIGAAMVLLKPESAPRGLHEIFITISGSETSLKRFRTMVYFNDI